MDRTTKVLKVDPVSPEAESIKEAADVIRAGGLVAFPTETVYGLGANAIDERAVSGIFEAKERPLSDPAIVHIADREALQQSVLGVPEAALLLTEAFWPGPLTVVLAKSEMIPDIVTSGRPTVAVRMPSHPVAQALIVEAGVPIAAPSANRFSRTSSTNAAHVLEDLDGRINIVLDGGPSQVGLESTIVAFTTSEVRILRSGTITQEQLQRVSSLPVVYYKPEADEAPGQLEKHYAPKASFSVLSGDIEKVVEAIRSEIISHKHAEKLLGVILFEETAEMLIDMAADCFIEVLGPQEDLPAAGAALYSAMRTLDNKGAVRIITHLPEGIDATHALVDRLRRAAGGRLTDV